MQMFKKKKITRPRQVAEAFKYTSVAGNMQQVSKCFSLTNDWPQSSYQDRLMQSSQTLEPDKWHDFHVFGSIFTYFLMLLHSIYKVQLKRKTGSQGPLQIFAHKNNCSVEFYFIFLN